MTTFLRPGIDFASFAAYLDQVHANWTKRRVEELEAQAAESGTSLPMPAVTIIQFEDVGGVVDLATGWITWPGGIRTAPVFESPGQVTVVEVKEEA